MSLRLETDKDISIDADLLSIADLPSIDEKDFEVTVSGDRFFMFHGERRNNCETKNKDEHLSKRSWAESTRQVLLPFEADPEKASARLDKGVLHAIPKTVTMTAYVALLADTAK
jgi:HSP20 family protein